MVFSQINVLGMAQQDVAQLQMGAGLHSLGRLEVEHGL